MDDKSVKFLKDIEGKFEVCDIFSFKSSSSWVVVKDTIFRRMFIQGGKVYFHEKSLLTGKVFYLSILSVLNYLKNLLKRKNKSLFVGAGSGLFEHNGEILDSYFTYNELLLENTIYFLSADHPSRLFKYRKFLIKNNIIIHSFIFSPFIILLTKILEFFSSRSISLKIKELLSFLRSNGGMVDKTDLLHAHFKFASGYIVYYLFLLPLRINKMYVVSSYSNSAIIAVLKKRGVEIIEVQHGWIGEAHRAYNYQFKDERLPAPNKMYVYNDFWKQELIDAGYYNEDQVSVYGRLKYDLVKDDKNAVKGNFIVFTGQNMLNKRLFTFLQESDKILSDRDLVLYYIPHPNELNKDLEVMRVKLGNCSNVKILTDKLYTTEKYIYDSIAHISVYSSCHFDAIHFKNRTYVLDIMDNNPMEHYLISAKEKYVLVKNINDVLNDLNYV